MGSHIFQPFHTPPPPQLHSDFHPTPTSTYSPFSPPHAPPHPSPAPAPYHAPYAPPAPSPYHAPYSPAPTVYPAYSFPQTRPLPVPTPVHPKSSPYNSLFTNDIREKNSRSDKEDIYLKTEAELANMDFSGPFFYHYKRKNKHGNLGKQRKP